MLRMERNEEWSKGLRSHLEHTSNPSAALCCAAPAAACVHMPMRLDRGRRGRSRNSRSTVVIEIRGLRNHGITPSERPSSLQAPTRRQFRAEPRLAETLENLVLPTSARLSQCFALLFSVRPRSDASSCAPCDRPFTPHLCQLFLCIHQA